MKFDILQLIKVLEFACSAREVNLKRQSRDALAIAWMVYFRFGMKCEFGFSRRNIIKAQIRVRQTEYHAHSGIQIIYLPVHNNNPSKNTRLQLMPVQINFHPSKGRVDGWLA